MQRRIWAKIERLLSEPGPVLASVARQRGIPPGSLAQAVWMHGLVRVLPGVYRRSEDPWDWDAKLRVAAVALPGALVTMDTAIAVADIESFLPRGEIWLGFPRKAHVPNLEAIDARAIRSDPATHWLDSQTLLSEHAGLRVHLPARAAVECLRRRALIGEEAAAAAFNSALSMGFATPAEILEYADACRAGRIARSFLASWSRRELVDESREDPDPGPRPKRPGRPPIRREPLPIALEFALRRGTLPPEDAKHYDVAEAKRRLRERGIRIPHPRKRDDA